MNNYMADFSEKQIQEVWDKARTIEGLDKSMYRMDYAGAIIKRDLYGKGTEQLDFGWEIDHVKPLSKNGSNDIDNLVPLHWKNNRHKDNNYPKFETIVSSELGKDNYWRNIEKEQYWEYK